MSAAEHWATERPGAPAAIVIGMSAGGLRPLRTIVEMLPRRSSAAVIIAYHTSGESVLPQLIRLWSGLDACFATDGAPLYAGRIYVCPPAHHVIVKPDGALGVARRGRLAHVQPSIDWLFESAAASFGDRAIAVLLSGANGDGTRGAGFVCRAGGMVLAQQPATCAYPQMPARAIAAHAVHLALPPPALVPVIAGELARIAAAGPGGWAEPFDEDPGAGPPAAERALPLGA